MVREKLTSSLRSSDVFEWEGWGDNGQLIIVKFVLQRNAAEGNEVYLKLD